jgi:hypothetical protein
MNPQEPIAVPVPAAAPRAAGAPPQPAPKMEPDARIYTFPDCCGARLLHHCYGLSKEYLQKLLAPFVSASYTSPPGVPASPLAILAVTNPNQNTGSYRTQSRDPLEEAGFQVLGTFDSPIYAHDLWLWMRPPAKGWKPAARRMEIIHQRRNGALRTLDIVSQEEQPDGSLRIVVAAPQVKTAGGGD